MVIYYQAGEYYHLEEAFEIEGEGYHDVKRCADDDPDVFRRRHRVVFLEFAAQSTDQPVRGG